MHHAPPFFPKIQILVLMSLSQTYFAPPPTQRSASGTSLAAANMDLKGWDSASAAGRFSGRVARENDLLVKLWFTIHGRFRKWWYPQIIHFNRVFHYKPSILGYPYSWKHPYTLQGTITYPIKNHFWVDDFPFPGWWDMLIPWRVMLMVQKSCTSCTSWVG